MSVKLTELAAGIKDIYGNDRPKVTKEQIERVAQEMNRRCRAMVDEWILSGPDYFTQPLPDEEE